MFKKRHDKYTFDHTPDTNIPRGVIAYVRMVMARNPRMWAIFIGFDILHALRYPVSFLLVGGVIDALTTLEAGAPIPRQVWIDASLIFLVLLIGELVHAIPHYIFFDWWKRARAELRSDLFAYTLKHSFTYFQNHFAGSLARKVSEGIEKGLMIGEQVRFQILLPMTSMFFSAIVLFKVSPIFGCIICVFVFAILFPVFLKLHKIREKSRIYADACSDVSGQIVDSLSNIVSVKSYAHEQQEMREHKRVSEVQMEAWHKMLRTFLMLDNYRRAVLILFGSGMMFACVIAWQQGAITIGDMSTIMGITFSFTGTAWYLSFGIIHLSESYGYLNDSLTTLIKPHSVSNAEEAGKLDVAHGEIAFDDVCFDYGAEVPNDHEGRPVFQNLDITIPAAQRVGCGEIIFREFDTAVL